MSLERHSCGLPATTLIALSVACSGVVSGGTDASGDSMSGDAFSGDSGFVPECTAEPQPGLLFVDRDGLCGPCDDSTARADNRATRPWCTLCRAVEAVEAGDTVYVRAGTYPEKVRFQSSGEQGRPITFLAFPGETVTVDGSIALSGWTPCASQAECGDNPNWANILVASIPADVTPASANLYTGEELQQVAQDPDPDNPLFFDQPSDWHPVPQTGYTDQQIIDPSVFSQSDSNHWAGGYILLHSANNNVFIRAIDTYDPATGTITFARTTDARHTTDTYALWNHLSLIDQAGEYAVSPSAQKIYFWPEDPSLVSQATISVLEYGFNTNGNSHIVIDGFRLRRFSNQLNGYYYGTGIGNLPGADASQITVRNNEITQLGLFSYPAICLVSADDVSVVGNYIHDTPSKGIFVSGLSTGHVTGAFVTDNRLERLGGTVIAFFYVNGGSILRNTMRDSNGQHANGITTYLDTRNVVIDGNTVINCNNALTMNTVTNLTITNNLLTDGPTQGSSTLLVVWDGIANSLLVDHNTLVNSNGHGAISVPGSGVDVTISNNITDGILLSNDTPDLQLQNNLYLGRAWNMDADEMGPGGVLEEDLSDVFVDPTDGDFTPVAGGVACSMSTSGGHVGAIPCP